MIGRVSGSDEQAGFLASGGAGAACLRTALHTSITDSHSLTFVGANKTGFSTYGACCLMEWRAPRYQVGARFADRRAIEQCSNMRQIVIEASEGESVCDGFNADNVAAGALIRAVVQCIAQLGATLLKTPTR